MTEYRCKRCGKTWFEFDGFDGMEYTYCEKCLYEMQEESDE